MTVRRRVMIADDHQIVRQGLRALLEKAGHIVVVEAANGREAVDLAAVNPVDIAVLDLIMPVLNGVDAARELIRVAPQTRTILLTMHADRPYVVEALQAGAKCARSTRSRAGPSTSVRRSPFRWSTRSWTRTSPRPRSSRRASVRSCS
jgi:DNA-binding NarL/FixJ family response regulator